MASLFGNGDFSNRRPHRDIFAPQGRDGGIFLARQDAPALAGMSQLGGIAYGAALTGITAAVDAPRRLDLVDAGARGGPLNSNGAAPSQGPAGAPRRSMHRPFFFGGEDAPAAPPVRLGRDDYSVPAHRSPAGGGGGGGYAAGDQDAENLNSGGGVGVGGGGGGGGEDGAALPFSHLHVRYRNGVLAADTGMRRFAPGPRPGPARPRITEPGLMRRRQARGGPRFVGSGEPSRAGRGGGNLERACACAREVLGPRLRRCRRA